MRLIDNETSITMNKRRNFVNYATMTLSNGTVLNLTPADFRIAGNTYTDDWVDGDAFQLGTAIGKTATILLDNTDGRTETIGSSEVVYPHGKFSQYDFYMAYFTLEVRLPEAHHVGGVLVDKSFVIGTFTVTQPVAHGATIEITGVDNMYMFDKSFDDCTLDFSSNPTLQTILNRCCDDCGVAKGSTTQNFNNRTLTVSEKPENTTYRQVVSWIAQIAGCNAVIGITGALELKWYDMSEFDNDLDGGQFDLSSATNVGESTYETESGSTAPQVDTYVSNLLTGLEGDYNAIICIDDISDISSFNCKVYVYYYSGSYSTVDTITLVEGANHINVALTLQNDSNATWYVIRLVQQNNTPITFKYKILVESYADGGSFSPWNTGYEADGGDFTTPLHYHNLTSTTGTEISTDDIQFTGVQIINGDTSINYPSTTGWDYYAMIIEDNPFVAGNESTIAQYIYGRLVGLKFRPFSCSSIQDPTIEAGDCALVYDVKGNTYYSIITNVNFKTGGMTEISCKAESPARQGNRFVNQAAYEAARALSKAEQYQDDYNVQVAHFNQLANLALWYYRTDEVESTGAMVTYIHDNSTLDTSTIIWKITASGIFISEDGGQSYNTGIDMSTGSMLMNLIYARGITADWIQAGTMTLGGYNNIDGILEVYNSYDLGNASVNANTYSSWVYFYYTLASNTSGNYTLYIYISGVTTSAGTGTYYDVQKSTDTGSSYSSVHTGYLANGKNGKHNKIDYTFTIPSGDTTNATRYRIRMRNTGSSFSYRVYYIRKNTTVNKNGIDTSAITARAGYIGNGSSGWTIGNISIYNGCTGVGDTTNAGTYVGTNGIRNNYINSGTLYYTRIYQGTLLTNNVDIRGGGINVNNKFKVESDGKLISTYGQIAGFDIDSSKIYKSPSALHATEIRSDGSFVFCHTINSSWTSLSYNNNSNVLALWTAGTTQNGGGFDCSGGAPGESGAGWVRWGWSDGQRSDGYTVSWYHGSDIRLKENILSISVEKVRKFFELLNPIKFNYNENSKANTQLNHYGIIAQEIEELLDEIGESNTYFIEDKDVLRKDESGHEYTEKYKYVHYEEFHGWELAGIKYLYEKIDKQQEEIDTLKSEVTELKQLVNSLLEKR